MILGRLDHLAHAGLVADVSGVDPDLGDGEVQTAQGKTVIDFGCGSGVLAIAALRLGAAHAIAIDHDPQALIATSDNADRNGVRDRLTVMASDARPAGCAAIVVANILANVLIDLAPTIGGLVEPEGRLVLSGVLADPADDVMQAYAGRVRFEPTWERDRWVLLHGTAQ